MNGPARYLRHLVDLVCREEQLSPEQILLPSMPVYGDLLSGDIEISDEMQLAIIEQVLNHCSRPGLGFRSAARYVYEDYGIFSAALSSCSTCREALDFLEKYAELDQPLILYKMEVTSAKAILHLTPRLPLGDVYQFAVEETLGVCRYSQLPFAEIASRASSVNLDFPEPSHASIYRSAFECDIRFDQEEVSIILPVDVLDEPPAHPNREAAKLFSDDAERQINELKNDEQVVARVQSLLFFDLKSNCRLPAVATSMHTTEKTLARQLREENTSFSQVLASVRQKRAIELLAKGKLTIENISLELGYGNVQSFERAFRKWHGVTPSTFRRKFRK